MRHAKGGRNGTWAWVAFLPLLCGSPSPAQDLPPEYLPPAHPAWRDVETLYNRGGLPDLPLFTRPLPRADVARALDAAVRSDPALAALPAARRLARELAFELGQLGSVLDPGETPPPFDRTEGGARFRIHLESRARASLQDGRGEIAPGTSFSMVSRTYLSGDAFVLADVGLERIVEAAPPGDAIVKGSDWFLSSTEAYVSVHTSWADVAAGLFRHRWGPGRSGTLLLSEAALSYPGLFYARTFGGRVRFVALTAALQSAEQRWYSAHRLDVAFGEALRIGVHESAAYFSPGPAPLYAVGVVPYTLVQRMLDRATTGGASTLPHRNNVMTGFDVVWRPARGWRLDAEGLIDDLATETSQQPHRLAFQAGLGWSGGLFGSTADGRLEVFKVYRYTYAVFYGADHIHDGTPLGFSEGPDVELLSAWLERDQGTDVRLGLGVDATRRGEGGTGEFWSPAEPASQNSGWRLSGTVETQVFPHVRGELALRDLLRLRGRLGAVRVTDSAHVPGVRETEVQGELEAWLAW